MIRNMKNDDLDKVMQIWLNTNISAHCFISECYWKNNFEQVRKLLPLSKIYVYECDDDIQGFIGISGNYIDGVFVRSEVQSKGIGKHLIDCAKDIKERLVLNVYQKNERAVKFYIRENFEIQFEKVDKNTNEKEYFMVWNRCT